MGVVGYMWNSAYARCVAKNDTKSIAWLRASYLNLESSYLDPGRDLAKLVYGHDINHVLLLHLGAFSSTILANALDLLEKKGCKACRSRRPNAIPYMKAIRMWVRGTAVRYWNFGSRCEEIKFPLVTEKPYKAIGEICIA